MKNRIRVLRAEQRWSQAELARRVGVTRLAIHAIENEKHEPSLRLAARIARAFQQSIDDVFDLSEV
ncbi:MAG: helix-turn-helix transcriptional regulator [Xanthomonadales bacterium]|nr:helix-turn-helix transcriptional regulator [Xanthomonadales bacterium]